jgi:hypothetical protein
MIVRILGDTQYDVPAQDCSALEDLDNALVKAVDSNDEAAFTDSLTKLIAEVRRAGTPLAADDFAPSDLVVPFADATLEETKSLLADSGDSTGSDGS